MKNYFKSKIQEEYKDILDMIIERVSTKFGKEVIERKLVLDGYPLVVVQLLFGGKSSSQLLSLVVRRWGLKEVQQDLNWLKELKEKGELEFHYESGL